MNTKTIFITVAVALFAAAVLTGTVVGIQYVSAWQHAHRGHHGGYASAMSSGGGMSRGGGMSNGGGGSGSSVGGGY